MKPMTRIALIGFGEVGQAFAEELLPCPGVALTAWDLQFADPQSPPSRAARRLRPAIISLDYPPGQAPVVAPGVVAAEDVRAAARCAGLVVSAVTAAQAVDAARAAAAALEAGAFFLDLNSSAPAAKREAAGLVGGAGGRYVEAAVMSPIEPRRLGAPMLLGGPHAEAFLAAYGSFGFSGARVFAEEIGLAAATKLCRSVVIKGFEALSTEALMAARRYGVEDVVLSSLGDLLPLPDWESTARYMIARSLEHGGRRAEEMREAARTVADAGVAPLMSEAIARRQAWAGERAAARSDELAAMLDALIAERIVP